MHSTPRTLIRQVQKDLSPVNGSSQKDGTTSSGETRNLMRAFIGVGSLPSADYKRILDNPVFSGYYPQITDKVFSLGRYASDVTMFDSKEKNGSHVAQQKGNAQPAKKSSKSVVTSAPVDQYASQNTNPFTSFESFLICINFTLLTGIALTVVIFALFILFLNNALYLKEEIV